jgi:hypothetical protein
MMQSFLPERKMAYYNTAAADFSGSDTRREIIHGHV